MGNINWSAQEPMCLNRGTLFLRQVYKGIVCRIVDNFVRKSIYRTHSNRNRNRKRIVGRIVRKPAHVNI